MEWDNHPYYGRPVASRRHDGDGGSYPGHQQRQQGEQQQATSDDIIRNLRAEVQRLRAAAQAAQRQQQQQQHQQPAAAAVTAADGDGGGGDDDHRKNNGKFFAANPEPLVRPNGFIDGRSNSQLAFEQKCQMLREFKNEFGHVLVPERIKGKYKKLPGFIMKQRERYRSKLMPPDRIAILQDEIGVRLQPQKSVQETWDGNFAKLSDAMGKIGHCCLEAVSSFDDPELIRWTKKNRRYLKAASQQRKAGSDAATNRKEDEKEQPNAKEEKKQQQQHLPVHWTDDKRDKLLSLNCPWLNCFDETDKAKPWKFTLNSTGWYKLLEQFRAYVEEHGDGFVPIQKRASGLPAWVREQRRVYDLVRSGGLETCERYEANFALLKSIGFVFDHDALQKEAERAAQLEFNMANTIPAADRLGAAKKREAEAQQVLDEANEKLKHAQQAAKDAKMSLTSAKLAVRKAEAEARLRPIGQPTKERADTSPAKKRAAVELATGSDATSEPTPKRFTRII